MILTVFILIAAVLVATALWFSVQLHRAFKHFKIQKMYTVALEAPSVTVCIPARNESHAMSQCIERVLASDYEKLEVIVFDDSSSDDTSALIRSFAYAGVRFVAGGKLPEGWLGRNHAFNVLAREASGTFVLFLDVDTAIERTTISQLVGYIITENVDMVSVVPRRNDTWRASVLFGTLRYFWQLVLSNRLTPASSGALWLIKRRTLIERFDALGKFKNHVLPEAKMAAELGVSRYHCLIANATLGVSYEKKWSSQVETSKRLAYPLAGGRWWNALLALVFLVILNTPFIAFLSGLIFNLTDVAIAGGLLTLWFVVLYGTFTAHTWKNRWWLGALLWPVIILQELVVFVRSWIGYARGTITWKGRPVLASFRNH